MLSGYLTQYQKKKKKKLKRTIQWIKELKRLFPQKNVLKYLKDPYEHRLKLDIVDNQCLQQYNNVFHYYVSLQSYLRLLFIILNFSDECAWSDKITTLAGRLQQNDFSTTYEAGKKHIQVSYRTEGILSKWKMKLTVNFQGKIRT